MPTTFDDEECYQLFIAMDNRARAFNGTNSEVNLLREKLLPFYRDWHAAHPHEVHPSAYLADALRENERLRAGIRAIKDGTVAGTVGGDDVVWFDTITTLYDFCDQLLADEQQACSLCGLRPAPKDPCADTACPAGR